MPTADHERILKAASDRALPKEVNGSSDFPVEIVKGLVDAGMLDAADVSGDDGNAFLGPRITLHGRKYLDSIRSGTLNIQPDRRGVWQMVKSALAWVVGILGSVIAGLILYVLVGD